MLIAQHNDDSPTMSHSVRCANNERTMEVISCPIRAVVQKEQDSTWDTSLGFRTILPGFIRSFAEIGERISIFFDSAKRVAEAAVESAIARFQRTGWARRWDGTFFTTWSTPLIGNLSKVDRKKAERINQELRKKLCQIFQTEAAIDLACDQDRVLREHFRQVARSHWEEILPPELEEIHEPRHLEQEEDEDDETETARGSVRAGKNGSSSDNTVTWDIRSQRSWLVHCDTQEQGEKLYGLFSKSYVVQRAKHDLYRFHSVQECCHAVYVLTNALALTWLTWKSEMESPLKH